MSMKHAKQYHLRAAKLRRLNEQKRKAEKQASRRLQQQLAAAKQKPEATK